MAQFTFLYQQHDLQADVAQLCEVFPLGPGCLGAKPASEEENVLRVGDSFEWIRLVLDHQLITFIFAGASVVLGAAVKKYVELWVEHRFRSKKEPMRTDPELLHDDFCRWIAEALRRTVLNAEKTRNQGRRSDGARLHVSTPRDWDSFVEITFTAGTGREAITVDDDPERFYQRWFNALRHIVVPFIALHASDRMKFIIQAQLGLENNWQVFVEAPGAALGSRITLVNISGDGEISNASPDVEARFQAQLNSNPPFVKESSTSVLHWRLCPEVRDAAASFAKLLDAGAITRCQRCLPEQ